MSRRVDVDVRDVVGMAIDIAESEGLDGMTMKAVADRLGIGKPALSPHVEGVSGLRRMVAVEAARRMAEAIEVATADLEGAEALRAAARAFRAYAAAHPGLYRTLIPGVAVEWPEDVATAIQEPIRAVERMLAEMGIPETERTNRIRALHSLLHGFVLLDAGDRFGGPEQADAAFEVALDVFIRGLTAGD